MSGSPRHIGFWPQVVRPVFSWLFACVAAGFFWGGYLTENVDRTVSIQHLHEIDWLYLLSDKSGSFLGWWAFSTAFIALLTSVTGLVSVLIVRMLKLPRGWSDILVPAFLPYFLLGLAFEQPGGVIGIDFWVAAIDLIPIGAIGGLIYWTVNGCPKVEDYA